MTSILSTEYIRPQEGATTAVKWRRTTDKLWPDRARRERFCEQLQDGLSEISNLAQINSDLVEMITIRPKHE